MTIFKQIVSVFRYTLTKVETIWRWFSVRDKLKFTCITYFNYITGQIERLYPIPKIHSSKKQRDDNNVDGLDNLRLYPIPEIYSFKKQRDDIDVDRLDKLRKMFMSGVSSEDNYKEYFHNLLRLEEVQAKINLQKLNRYNVRLQKYEKGECAAKYVLHIKDNSHSIRIGARILLKAHDLGNKCFIAIVEYIDNTYITLKLLRSLDAGLFWQYDLSYTSVDVIFLPSRLTFIHMHAAIDRFPISKIFPQEANDDTICSRIDRFFNQKVKMNSEQRTAVECVVAGSSGAAPFLLHGPPGTGKTVTIVEAILQLVIKNKSNRVLVCAHSNTAVDNVACLLLKYTKRNSTRIFLRINSACRRSPPECLKNVSKSGKLETEELKHYRILLCTLNLVSNYDLSFITHTIIDEAAQATEPSCLIPKSQNLTLSGDFKQLGPVVVSDAAKKFGLGVSLMERLKETCPLYAKNNNNKYMIMLKNNYRSDADIIKLPNLLFYEGQLKARAETDLISRTNILYKDKPCRAIVFHGVLSTENKVGDPPSYRNSDELIWIKKYVTMLLKTHGVKQEDIGIIATYSSQVALIKEWVQKHHLKINVETVDAFQGQEKRVILISTVRGDGIKTTNVKLGFITDAKRFNVALTRAKAKVVVIGNPLCLRADPLWNNYIRKCRKYGTYYGFDMEKLEMTQTSYDNDELSAVMKKISLK